MLSNPESVRRRAEIAAECRAGEITKAEAGARLIEADPGFGGGYILLGNERVEAGDLAGAESCYWGALERMPCEYTAYLALSDVRRKQNESDSLAQRLTRLGFWKLALSAQIPDEVVSFFGERTRELNLDCTDSATFEVLATALEPAGDVSEEMGARLLPYELLNDLQCDSADGIDGILLADIRTHAERSIPLWRAALRRWVEAGSAPSQDTLGLLIALLGELDGPGVLDDLLELAVSGERRVLLHANWAIWRLGQRFPAEALAKFRAAAPGAGLILRCALADHIDLLPETAEKNAGLVELLEGFAGFAHEDDASYLLAMVMQSLRDVGRAGEAEEVFERLAAVLSKADREWVLAQGEEGLLSKLREEAVDGLTIEEICSDRILMDDEEEADERDWEEEEAIAPVVARVKPGRNEPCWCGRGKKYKKCHLAADEAADFSAQTKEPPVEPLDARLREELVRCVAGRRHRPEYREAHRLYFGQPPEQGEEESDDVLGGFVEWYIHDFRPAATGQTQVEEYLEKRAGRVTAAERELLESWRDARFGLWEVQRVEIGTGVELKDRFVGDQLFVHDVSSSRSLVRWDCALSRVHLSQGKWYFVGNGLLVPRTLMPRLTEQIECESREAGQTPAAFVRANSHRWRGVVNDLNRQQLADLRVANAEGDELEFSAAVYQVEDETGLIAALESAKPFEPAGDGGSGVRSFAWLERRREGPRRSYGRIEIRNGQLRLECNSRKRLEIGRQLVEKHGGARLRHVADSFESLDAMKRKVLEKKPAPKVDYESRLPPEVERELLAKVKSEHYARWVDECLPALGGRTPREAARSETGRRALDELLRTMENSEERARRKDGVAFDFTPIRKSLGL